jgi:hypothetical protein
MFKFSIESKYCNTLNLRQEGKTECLLILVLCKTSFDNESNQYLLLQYAPKIILSTFRSITRSYFSTNGLILNQPKMFSNHIFSHYVFSYHVDLTLITIHMVILTYLF